MAARITKSQLGLTILNMRARMSRMRGRPLESISRWRCFDSSVIATDEEVVNEPPPEIMMAAAEEHLQDGD